ncbi:MAG: hypothetical protein AABP62_09410 [Planctomycetota bacterium]
MQTPATSADAAPDPADIVIAQAETRQRRRWRWLIVGGVASSILSYVLSAGPALMLERQGKIPGAVRPLVLAAYLPLAWSYENIGWVRYSYDLYFWLLGMGV